MLSTKVEKETEIISKYERALQDFNVKFHKQHVLVILTSLHLAIYYYHGNDQDRSSKAKPQNNLLRAEQLLKQAESGLLDYLKTRSDSLHPVLAIVQYHLGKVYAKKCNHVAAQKTLSQAFGTINSINEHSQGSWMRLRFSIKIARGHAQLEVNRSDPSHAMHGYSAAILDAQKFNKPVASHETYQFFMEVFEELLKLRKNADSGKETSHMDRREERCLFAQIVIGAAHAALDSSHSDIKSAKNHCSKAIDLLEVMFPEPSRRPIQWCEAQAMLARLCLRLKKYKKATNAAKASHRGFAGMCGKNTLAASDAAKLVGVAYAWQLCTSNPSSVDYEAAIDWLKLAADGCDLVLGHHHQLAVRAYIDRGHVHAIQKRHSEAVENWKHAQKRFHEMHGPDSNEVRDLNKIIKEVEELVK